MPKQPSLVLVMPAALAELLRDLRDNDKVMALAVANYLAKYPGAIRDMLSLLDQ